MNFPEMRWRRLSGGIFWGGHHGEFKGKCRTEICRADSEVVLWLNLDGEGLIWGRTERFVMKPGMFALTGGEGRGRWEHTRQPGNHRVECVKLGYPWLRERVGRVGWGAGEEHLATRLFTGQPLAFCGLMGVWEKDLCQALAAAAKHGVPEGLVAEARILEWAANRLFHWQSDAGQIRERGGPVATALALLHGRIAEPLDLSSLAREVGVSAPHLCRLVKQQTGMTLQRHLRRLRIGYACEMLASGRANITETALECGYQSLSHFSKAFREELGGSPRDWLAGRRKQVARPS